MIKPLKTDRGKSVTYLKKISQPNNFGFGIADHLTQNRHVIAFVGFSVERLLQKPGLFGVPSKTPSVMKMGNTVLISAFELFIIA